MISLICRDFGDHSVTAWFDSLALAKVRLAAAIAAAAAIGPE
jgi:hypothetical protein